MSRRDRTVILIAALLVAVCCVVAVTFAAPVGAQSPVAPQVDDQPEPDNTITRISLADDGSATWEITLRTRLENDSSVDEYEGFQERFRSNTSRYLDPFAERMTGVVAAANDSTDREMRATDFEADTSIQEVPRRWGVVTFRFTWTGFAAVDGDAVVVGDVFDGGFFIGDGDALAVVAPDGYVIADASPSPDEIDDGTAEWQGREDFTDGRPSVRAVPATTGDDAGDDAGGDGSGGSGAETDPVGLRSPFTVGALLLAAVLAVVAVGVRTGRIGRTGRVGRIGLGGDGADDDHAGSEGPDEMPAVSGGAPDAGSEPGNAESTGSDPALLTDEDRVRRTLRDEGGRMKQSDVVDALGWSKSKTSRVLGRMAEDGEVEKLRLGRENVIDLVDEE